jgi:endonuclease/exonuclease/phosphatase (EEP) superfamily protein YafD
METLLLFGALALALGTFIPETGNDFWLIRGQDYFKSFYAVLNLVLIIFLLFSDHFGWKTYAAIVLAVISFFFCLLSIMPFLGLAKITVKATEEKINKNTLSIYVSNVYQENREYDRSIAKVKELDPDLLFFLETDHGWDQALSTISLAYPYVLKEVKDDTYGLILMSKFPFDEGEIIHRVKGDIPSVEVSFKMGKLPVKVYGLHPKPPVPGEALTAKKKDREILKTALAIHSSELEHHLVIGDLNDVAWSGVTRKFKRLTGMKDPRQGRGFYPTFPTWSPFRIPLDHVFCSPAFELVEFKRVESVGSDHFPVFVKFYLPQS